MVVVIRGDTDNRVLTAEGTTLDCEISNFSRKV